MTRYGTTKHSQLWNFLDALEIYETWFVPQAKLPSNVRGLFGAYTRRGGKHILRVLTVNVGDQIGALFVRIG